MFSFLVMVYHRDCDAVVGEFRAGDERVVATIPEGRIPIFERRQT